MQIFHLDSAAFAFLSDTRMIVALGPETGLVQTLRAAGYTDAGVVSWLVHHKSLSETAARRLLQRAQTELARLDYAQQDDLVARHADRFDFGSPLADIDHRVSGFPGREIGLGSLRLTVRAPSEHALAGVESALGRTRADPASPSQRLDVLCEPSGTIRIAVAGRPLKPQFDPAGLAPAVRMGAEHALYLSGIAHATLHAAALALDDALILLTGAQGSGKSTLAYALCRAGARLLSEDIVPVRWKYGLTVLPFALPIGLKTGSFPVLARFGAEPGAEAIWPRPDGQQETYVTVPTRTQPLSVRRCFLVHPHYDGGDTRLTSTAPANSLRRLLDQTFAINRLDADDFGALVAIMRQSVHADLRFGDARHAADTLVTRLRQMAGA